MLAVKEAREMTEIYSLPDWDFVGGEYQKRSWTLYRPNGKLQDLAATTVSLSISEYINPSETPILRTTTDVVEDSDGRCCVVTFDLQPEWTIDMNGTYIYQLTFKQNGRTMIPFRGMMHITQNIDKWVVDPNAVYDDIWPTAESIVDALGYTPANADATYSEEWTFDLEDGSSVTKQVVLMKDV